MITPKMDTFGMMRYALLEHGRVYWSPSQKVYCSYFGNVWLFTVVHPVVSGASRDCPVPMVDDWEPLKRKEPQRGDVHPSCESCGSAMGYTGNTVVCTDPLVSTDRLHPARIPRPDVSYCSNHTAMRGCREINTTDAEASRVIASRHG